MTSRREKVDARCVRPPGDASSSNTASHIAASELPRLDAPQQPLQIAGSRPSSAARARHSAARSSKPTSSRLGLPGRERRRLGRARARRPALGERRLDLRAPAAERPQHRLGHADQLGDPVPDRQPLDPERPRQLGAQHGLVDEARRPRVRVQPPAVERRPAPVHSAAEVRDQDVRVQLRIAGPRRPMPERRRHQPGRLLDLAPPWPRRTAAADRSRYPSASRAARSCARRTAARSSRSPIPKSTLTLFGAENVRSNPATRTRLDDARNGVPSCGSQAGEDAPQRITVDRAREPERRAARADPGAARLGAPA